MRELSLHILDCLENAVEAGATRIALTIAEDTALDRLTITVEDNGQGMPAGLVGQVLDAFVTTRKTRHVGLGLPLLAAAAERTGGRVTVQSRPGEGTVVRAVFGLRHLDRAPLGDLPSTLMAMLLAQPPVELAYRHQVDDRVFACDTAELVQVLGEVPLTHPQVRTWLREYLVEGIAGLERPYP